MGQDQQDEQEKQSAAGESSDQVRIMIPFCCQLRPFLDAIASPCNWCCHSVGGPVTDNFRFAIFFVNNIFTAIKFVSLHGIG